MVINSLGHFGQLSARTPALGFAGALVGLHLTLLAGADTLVGMMCWLVDVGFFILWQPFVQAERKVDNSGLLWLTLVLVSGMCVVWLVAADSVDCAAGGSAWRAGDVASSHRPTRIFYLIAFAYLLVALLVFLVPKVVPQCRADWPFAGSPICLGGAADPGGHDRCCHDRARCRCPTADWSIFSTASSFFC